MKSANIDKTPAPKALTQPLNSYRSTPHPATWLPPAAMMFRNLRDAAFPSKEVNNEDILQAQQKDRNRKEERKLEINNSKYKSTTSDSWATGSDKKLE